MAKRTKHEFPTPIVNSVNADSEIRFEKVEPANWWIGMRKRIVTLTIYGHNVALTRAVLKADGVSVASCSTLSSANYLFVNLDISPQARPGVYDIALTCDGHPVASIPFELKERKRDSALRRGVTPADVVYLAMPDRFAHSDGCGSDADTLEKFNRKAPRGRHGGNLCGVRDHAAYLAGLGVTALWLTPVQLNDMPSDSFHGYAMTDFYSVDPRLGSLADYFQLSASLRQWGIKLIMDVVINHCGSNHLWMRDAPSDDWFSPWPWKPELTNYRPGVSTDVHASRYDLRHTVRGWFDYTMPDLNFENPRVINYMAQMVIWWIETADLSGLRVDTFPYVDRHGAYRWLEAILDEYPDLSIVTESWVSDSAKLAGMVSEFYFSGKFPLQNLPQVMDFPLQEAVSRAFTEDFGWGMGANRLYDVVSNDHLFPKSVNLMVFGDNHDTGRLLTRLGGDVAALKMAMAFLLTTRGVPQIYYGTEILLDGDSSQGDARIRQDMPGGWASDKDNMMAKLEDGDANIGKLSPKDEQRADMYDYIARIARFRKQSHAIAHGRLTHFVPTDNVYVYFRVMGSERVLVILNMLKTRTRLNTERFAELVSPDFTGIDVVSGNKLKIKGVVTVPPRTAAIISINPD